MPRPAMSESTKQLHRVESALSQFVPRERSQPRDAWIRIRVNDEERAAFQACADKFEMTVSTLVRQLVSHANEGVSGRQAR